VTCEDVASAAASALSVGLTPIICMDDSERETQLERLSEKLRLSAPSSPGSKKIILAYEPTNFIGSDTTAQSAQIASFIGTCNNFCAQLDLACNVRYVYGGSVTPPVIPLLRELTLLDGILLGRSGVDEYMFKQIIESYAS
jgi:triosephosphate isomerase